MYTLSMHLISTIYPQIATYFAPDGGSNVFAVVIKLQRTFELMPRRAFGFRGSEVAALLYIYY
jgi:hypothetical protein